MRESAVWKSLKDSGQLPFSVRIESPASPGVPDVYFALGNGITGWIELKSVPDSQRVILKQLRPLQILWARKASEKNIFTTVLLFHKKRAILVAGRDVSSLLDAQLDCVLEKALWVGETTPSRRWNNLQEKLNKHGKPFFISMAAEGS